ncbi:hypothetical protein C5167_027299 [Papaver somniferum]|nr:hypothetical protein C5167_027299 [Papaver somniferum]
MENKKFTSLICLGVMILLMISFASAQPAPCSNGFEGDTCGFFLITKNCCWGFSCSAYWSWDGGLCHASLFQRVQLKRKIVPERLVICWLNACFPVFLLRR